VRSSALEKIYNFSAQLELIIRLGFMAGWWYRMEETTTMIERFCFTNVVHFGGGRKPNDLLPYTGAVDPEIVVIILPFLFEKVV
jgi:hypothetical protein